MPAVPGGIRGEAGELVAPDPASLPPDELDLPTLWRHPDLLFAQTCWGPLETTDLGDYVRVVGQSSYDAFEGGQGEFYSSVLAMRAPPVSSGPPIDSPACGKISVVGNGACLPLERIRGTRLAYNEPHSRSGILGLAQDLETIGEDLSIFAERIPTGAHRASMVAVAEGRADLCAIDCRTWSLARRFEPAISRLTVVGSTRMRPGLPYVTANNSPLRAL